MNYPLKAEVRATISTAPQVGIVLIPTCDLKEYSVNDEIYAQRDDPAFVESIRQYGILQPLIVKSDRKQVISGARRLKTARQLGITSVPCLIRDFDNDIIALIEYNRYRVKSPLEVYKEARVLRRELEEEALEHQRSGRPLDRSDQRSNPVHVREVVAEKLGVSSGYLSMLEKVVESGDHVLVNRLESGFESVNSAYRRLVRPKETIPNISLGQYYAGKHYLAPTIISMMPPHKCYVEPFGGYANVLLRKPETLSQIEVYNDKERDLVNLILCLRDEPLELIGEISQTPYSRWYFIRVAEELSGSARANPPDTARAAKFWCLNQMVFNGLKRIPSEGDFRSDASANRTFARRIPSLLQASARLRNVQLENRHAFKVVEHYDSADTLAYLDPPYYGYEIEQALGHGLTRDEHVELANILHHLQGDWILTYNDCKEIRDLYRDCTIREILTPQNAVVGEVKKEPFRQLIISNFNSEGQAGA